MTGNTTTIGARKIEALSGEERRQYCVIYSQDVSDKIVCAPVVLHEVFNLSVDDALQIIDQAINNLPFGAAVMCTTQDIAEMKAAQGNDALLNHRSCHAGSELCHFRCEPLGAD